MTIPTRKTSAVSLPSGYGLEFVVSILKHLVTKCLVWLL